MANLIETREKVEKAIENIDRWVNKENVYQTTGDKAIALALLYVGDELAYMNKTLDQIQRHTNRIG